MSSDGMTREQAFLLELLALHQKYGVTSTSCGCCDSPAVEGAGINVGWVRVLKDKVRYLDRSRGGRELQYEQ